MSRIIRLHKRAFYLFDREKEPETSERRQIIDAVNAQPGHFAAMTSKRAVENYLHPLAILEACSIDLSFDDDTDIGSLLARKMLERNHADLSWQPLPPKRQRRLHKKAKKMLNIKAAHQMTPALMALRDTNHEVIGWMRSIRQLIEMKA